MERAGRFVQVLIAVEIVAFTVIILSGLHGSGFDPLIDGWLQGGAYVTIAVLAVLRVVARPADRRVWIWIAAALSARALAFVLYLSWIRTIVPPPYPSVADVLWLGMAALLFVGLVVLARAQSAGVAPSLWLDGLVGALAAAAVFVALFYGTLHRLTAPGTPTDAVITNLAYPFSDLALLLVILGVLVAYEWRPPPVIWLLGAGVAGFAINDSVFLYQLTAGTYRPGTWLSAFSLVATALIALAAWQPPRPAAHRRLEGLSSLLLPTGFALVCLAILLVATEQHVVDAAIWLCTAGMVVAIVRTGVTLDALRRERAAARAARDEAERANRAKSEFLSRMSHELRTPLNAILGFGQLLELDRLTPEQRSSADQITAAGRHLLELIDEVLDLARVESGELHVTLAPVAVTDAIDDAIGLVTPLAAARGIRLRRSPAHDGLYVQADAQRLRQVLLNLLSNAVKYNRDGGEVRVTVERIGEGVVIAVADTGAGIAPEDLDRLFVPFERLGEESGTIEGTGLGLVLARRMVEAMGGTIGVESEPGRGSTFRVELAAARVPAMEPVTASTEPSPARVVTGARSVLYVEDNRSNRLLVERVLARRPDVKLLTAECGVDGIELARRHLPDVILLDLHLSDLSGEEVLHRLRADPTTAELTIVVVSADATPARRARLAAAGADGYLTKPFRLEAVLELLDGGTLGPMPADTNVDAARLAELRELDEDGEALRALSEAFLEDAAARVDEVIVAARAGDHGEVQAAAHALMGAASTFGARELGELAAAVRSEAQAGRVPGEDAQQRLLDALEAARGAFTRLIADA